MPAHISAFIRVFVRGWAYVRVCQSDSVCLRVHAHVSRCEHTQKSTRIDSQTLEKKAAPAGTQTRDLLTTHLVL